MKAQSEAAPHIGLGYRAEGLVEFRNAVLREFLRARRARLTPESVGIAPRRRWSYPGLRLQEVAELANVSTGWYTKLELGEAKNITPRTLSAVAMALRLDEAEKSFLFHLTGTALPQPSMARPSVPDFALVRLVEENDTGFAILLDFRYDILAANEAARRFGLSGPKTGIERNLFWRYFFSTEFIRLSGARRALNTAHIVAILRRVYAESDGDLFLEELIGKHLPKSEEFVRFWQAQSVSSSFIRRLPLLLPSDEVVLTDTVVLTAEGGFRVCYFEPVDDINRRILRNNLG